MFISQTQAERIYENMQKKNEKTQNAAEEATAKASDQCPDEDSILTSVKNSVNRVGDALGDKLNRFFNDGPDLVDETIDFALRAKTPNADRMALKAFKNDIQNMDSQDLADTQDYIVKRMAGEKSPRVRGLLHQMYQTIDAQLECKPALKPRKIPFPPYFPPPIMPHFPLMPYIK